MAHARKGGISHSPGQRFATPKQRYAPPEWWFAPAGGFFPPPSKIENRRLLIKKTAKRYEHSAGLRVESSERQNESGGWPQAKGGPKRETDTNANRLGVPDAPKTQPKALAPNRPRRSAIPRQKTPLGASLQRFLPWLSENATMGPLGAPRSHRKSSKKSGEARKAAGKPPIGPRTPR